MGVLPDYMLWESTGTSAGMSPAPRLVRSSTPPPRGSNIGSSAVSAEIPRPAKRQFVGRKNSSCLASESFTRSPRIQRARSEPDLVADPRPPAGGRSSRFIGEDLPEKVRRHKDEFGHSSPLHHFFAAPPPRRLAPRVKSEAELARSAGVPGDRQPASLGHRYYVGKSTSVKGGGQATHAQASELSSLMRPDLEGECGSAETSVEQNTCDPVRKEALRFEPNVRGVGKKHVEPVLNADRDERLRYDGPEDEPACYLGKKQGERVLRADPDPLLRFEAKDEYHLGHGPYRSDNLPPRGQCIPTQQAKGFRRSASQTESSLTSTSRGTIASRMEERRRARTPPPQSQASTPGASSRVKTPPPQSCRSPESAASRCSKGSSVSQASSRVKTPPQQRTPVSTASLRSSRATTPPPGMEEGMRGKKVVHMKSPAQSSSYASESTRESGPSSVKVVSKGGSFKGVRSPSEASGTGSTVTTTETSSVRCANEAEDAGTELDSDLYSAFDRVQIMRG